MQGMLSKSGIQSTSICIRTGRFGATLQACAAFVAFFAFVAFEISNNDSSGHWQTQ